MGFPLFHGGISPLEPKGRGGIAEIDVRIQCGGVLVSAGDLIVGDADGVIVVPKEVETQALERAIEKMTGEDRTRAEVEGGMKLAQVYEKFGIL